MESRTFYKTFFVKENIAIHLFLNAKIRFISWSNHCYGGTKCVFKHQDLIKSIHPTETTVTLDHSVYRPLCESKYTTEKNACNINTTNQLVIETGGGVGLKVFRCRLCIRHILLILDHTNLDIDIDPYKPIDHVHVYMVHSVRIEGKSPQFLQCRRLYAYLFTENVKLVR